jgi:hypothetical protein
VSGGPITKTSHLYTSLSSTSPAENPSTGWRRRSKHIMKYRTKLDQPESCFRNKSADCNSVPMILWMEYLRSLYRSRYLRIGKKIEEKQKLRRNLIGTAISLGLLAKNAQKFLFKNSHLLCQFFGIVLNVPKTVILLH